MQPLPLEDRIQETLAADVTLALLEAELHRPKVNVLKLTRHPEFPDFLYAEGWRCSACLSIIMREVEEEGHQIRLKCATCGADFSAFERFVREGP